MKLRKAEPGADSFNNVPRYDLAAYELQKLFLDPAEYVVPPTALRMVPLADFAKYSPDVERTFPGADQVLAVVQYWLSDITVIADVYDPAALCRRPGLCAPHRPAERAHVSDQASRLEPRQLPASARQEVGARVFSIDHGVAFASEDSDRGDVWKDMRVNQLPADTVERLRQVTPATADGPTGRARAVATPGRQLRSGGERKEPRGKAAASVAQGNELQMGLTKSEIREVHRLLTKTARAVDNGKITIVPAGRYLRIHRCPGMHTARDLESCLAH